MRRAVRELVTVLVGSVTCLVGTVVAVPGVSNAVTWPTMRLFVYVSADAHEVCAEGELRGSSHLTGGKWTFALTGTRGDTTQILYGTQGDGDQFEECLTAYKNWTATGAYTIEFTYAGVGDDLTWSAGGYGYWRPADDYVTVDWS